ncbi:MAG: hypothetical protein AAF715_31590 [Myxococcota bacterium]
MRRRDPEVAQLREGARDPDTNLPTYDGYIPDGEEWQGVDVFQALGVSSIPYPEDADGFAEGVILRGCGGSVGCVVGGRDERCAQVYATMRPGDSCLHSTDPDAKAQVQTKANRQAVMITEASDGSTMLHILDGKNDKVQIAAFGGVIEMRKDGITITGPGGASLVMKGDTVSVIGKFNASAGASQSMILADLFLASFSTAIAAATSGLQGPTSPATNTQVSTALTALNSALASASALFKTKVTFGQ